MTRAFVYSRDCVCGSARPGPSPGRRPGPTWSKSSRSPAGGGRRRARCGPASRSAYADLRGRRNRGQQGRRRTFRSSTRRSCSCRRSRCWAARTPGDLVTPGKRFFQYDYRLRLIAEDAFGNDVAIPPLEISYRIESKVAGRRHRAGPRSVVLAAARVDAADLARARRHHRHSRSAGGAVHRRSRTAIRAPTCCRPWPACCSPRRRRRAGDADRHAAPQDAEDERRESRTSAPRTILGAVAKELDDVQRASRGGWTPELAGRALAALRIAGTLRDRPRRRAAAGQAGETPQRWRAASFSRVRPRRSATCRASATTRDGRARERDRGPGRCAARR